MVSVGCQVNILELFVGYHLVINACVLQALTTHMTKMYLYLTVKYRNRVTMFS